MSLPSRLSSAPRRPRKAVLPAYRLLLAAVLLPATARGDDWPQWRGPTRDGVWHESGVVEKFAEKQIPIRWRAKIAGGYSPPTVAAGRVYVTDRVIEPKEIERVHCFDAATGESLWTHAYDCPYNPRVTYVTGPRAAVTIVDGLAYSLGTMGHLFCLDAAGGSVMWQHDLEAEYGIRFDQLIWGVSASPLVEGDLVIVQVGGEGVCLAAFDRRTGKERWRALDERASYSAPIVIEQAGRRVLVCWTGDSVSGLDPATGELLWSEPFKPRKMVLAVASPVVEGDRLFLTGFYDGSMMLRLAGDKPAVEKLWHRRGRSEGDTEALHSIISTPLFIDDHVYGVDSYGELRCLAAVTGDRVWESIDVAVPNVRWGTIHMVKNADKIWMFNELGELIISQLSPKGFEEISRAKLIEPTTGQLEQREGGVCWAHPAYANRHVFARNDNELVAADLSHK